MPFSEISSKIKNSFSVYSVDLIYHNKHPFIKVFDEKLMLDFVALEAMVKDILNVKTSLLEIRDNFLNDTLKNWLIKNGYSPNREFKDLSEEEKNSLYTEEGIQLAFELTPLLYHSYNKKTLDYFSSFFEGGSLTHLLKKVFWEDNSEFHVNEKEAMNELKRSLTQYTNEPKILNVFDVHDILSIKSALLVDKIITENKNQEITSGFIDIVPMFFILSRSLEKHYIRTGNGVVFLDLGNSIFATILVRRNINSIKNVTAQIYHKKSFTYNPRIYDGYTSSGPILKHGIYLVSEKYIFEIWFRSDALLGNSMNKNYAQRISDSKRIDDDND